MNFFYIFLLFPFFVLGKSNLDFTLNNNIEFRSKEELLKPINGELFLGNKDAKIKIVVFDSYSCIHCARFYSEIFPILEENYIKTNCYTRQSCLACIMNFYSHVSMYRDFAVTVLMYFIVYATNQTYTFHTRHKSSDSTSNTGVEIYINL